MRHLATRPEQIVACGGPNARLAGRPGHRYRLMIFERSIGPWRETRTEAELDAIYSGNGSRDEWTGDFYLTVPAWIREELSPD